MKWTIALLASAAIVAAACTDGSITKPAPPPPPPPPAGQLVIRSERDTTLSADTLSVGGKLWVRVIGVDTAAAVSWSVNDTAVAGVLEKHFARLHINARKVGNAVVRASLDGRSGTFALVMQQAPDTNHPTVGYDPIDLGTLGGNSARPFDLNNQGQVVGRSKTASGAQHAFLWDGAGMHDLGTLGHDGSEAVRINNAGVIAGTVWTRITGNEDDNKYTWSIATIWRNGVPVTLDSTQVNFFGPLYDPSGYDIFDQPARIVRAINGSGAIAWISYGKFDALGFLWDNGWHMLSVPGRDGSYPIAMNDRGQVVGAVHQSEASSLSPFHAFVWEGGSSRDLGVLTSWACSLPGYGTVDCSTAAAMDINADGKIVGVSTDGTGRYHFVLWENGSIEDLGSTDRSHRETLPRVFINDRGEIAGSTGGQAFFWSGGVKTALPSSGRSLEVAGLGENGEVIGTSLAGAEQHAFVWSQARGMIDLGTGPQGFSAAWVVDINRQGDILGYTAPCKLDAQSRCTDLPIDYGFNPAFAGGDVRAILWRKN